jgi:hypothetical protein
LLLAVAAIGLSGVLSFAAPTAGKANNNKANNNKARTKAPQRDGTSPTERAGGTASLECKRQCRADYKCHHGDWNCGYYDCISLCEQGSRAGLSNDKPPKQTKSRPRTPRPPTP